MLATIAHSDDAKCCENCPSDLIKTYSVDHTYNHCAEGCIKDS